MTRMTKVMEKRLRKIRDSIKKQIGVDIGNKNAQEVMLNLLDGNSVNIQSNNEKFKIKTK